ncbi:LANO_0E02124g1_1 [Lachancea nothofagi CBS 11611]|uniref:ditrans,polycis-polyprenyl diphosphate synthase [(2E,6E)-farnesyldiphosphate specific] n=1 Tax=Lachancea nothofagi CBS 11611 TaxID=1266666 RepID=A0A1G4JQ94_9SACH|nr:LANO_0E02124g1_1 [Lachancea nothofagi CBS 11611]
MTKIQDSVLKKQDEDWKKDQRDHKRVPAITNGIVNPAKPSVGNVKRALETAILTPPDSEEVRKQYGQTQGLWSQSSGKLEYALYKTFLSILFVIYACVRYIQYEYNRVKIRILNLAYSPSNTPQLIRQDVMKLQKLPKRLAAILEKKREGDVGGGTSGLLNDGSELVAWSISAGIKHLTLYDYDGHLKRNVDEFRSSVFHKLCKYYDPTNVPKFAVRIPQWNKVYFNSANADTSEAKKVAIEISLLSNRDGRETIIDLTKTMAELCAHDEMKLSDITMKLIDSELTQLVGHEPDLLLYFGPSLDLQGFPPWHIRLTEFYWERDNDQVTYSVFIRGLKKYASCKMNVGK